MLKKRLVTAALTLALFAALAPAPSQAAPRGWAAADPAAASFFLKLERWWSLLLNGAERPVGQKPSPAQQKNGCGIDPNGGTGCGPNPAPGQATAPTDPSELG